MVVRVILTDILVSSATSGILSWILNLVSLKSRAQKTYQELSRLLIETLDRTPGRISQALALPSAASEKIPFVWSVPDALSFPKNYNSSTCAQVRSGFA